MEQETVIRGHELPVQAVTLPDDEDGRPLLQACWRQSRFLSAWLMRECINADARPTASMTKLPKWVDPKLYERFTGLTRPGGGRSGERVRVGGGYPDAWFFEGATQTTNSLIARVRADYARYRGRVLLDGIGRFPEYVLGEMPWYVDADQWLPLVGDDGELLVSCRLPGPGRGESARTMLRLRGGKDFVRQVAHFRALVGKPASERAELSIFARRLGSNSPHRPAIWMHGEPFRIMVRLTARVPVQPRTSNRTLVLLTDSGAFWVAELDGRRAWVLNADHVRRTVAAHAEHLRCLQRLSEDGKAERRMTGNRAVKQQARLERLCLKDRRRLASFTHEAAAHLAQFAHRQGVGNVLYLDRERGFVSRFPWFELERKLAQKLAVAGIGLYCESGRMDPAPEDLRPTEGKESPWMIDIAPTTPEDDDRWTRIQRLREAAARKVMAARLRKGSHAAVSAP